MTFFEKVLLFTKTNLVMIRKKLKKEVTIRGINIFLQNASITFLPAGKQGWYLRTLTHGNVPIDHRIARHREARIQLHCGDTTLNIWEHIGALRFLGIDEVVVVVHNKWPPFLGGMKGYYPEFLKEGVLEECGILPTIKPLQYRDYETFNHVLASTKISPADTLELQVWARWGTLPWYKEHFVMEKIPLDQWEEIWNSVPQGWLRGRNALLSLGVRLLKKNVSENIAWIKNFKTLEETSRAWGYHRVQDIFGCLSLCSHIALPAMQFNSYCAGHREDLVIVKECF